MADEGRVAAELTPPSPEPGWTICKVTAVGVSSITVNYKGTAVVIPKAQVFTGTMPDLNQWVAIASNGGDRIVIGKRVP